MWSCSLVPSHYCQAVKQNKYSCHSVIVPLYYPSQSSLDILIIQLPNSFDSQPTGQLVAGLLLSSALYLLQRALSHSMQHSTLHPSCFPVFHTGVLADSILPFWLRHFMALPQNPYTGPSVDAHLLALTLYVCPSCLIGGSLRSPPIPISR